MKLEQVRIAPLKLAASIFVLLTLLFALTSQANQLTWLPEDAHKVHPRAVSLEGQIAVTDTGDCFLIATNGDLYLLGSDSIDFARYDSKNVVVKGFVKFSSALLNSYQQADQYSPSMVFQPVMSYPKLWVVKLVELE